MPTALEKEINSEDRPSPSPTPRIIPRADHRISRQNIDREALKILYRLRDEGHTAYLVGGGVRDLYLGKTPKDFDISTDARPGQIRKIFKNSRLIGRRFRLVQVFFRGGKIVEVSTFRRRNEYELNGKTEVLASDNTFGTPAEDAFRRDLTINALFYEINDFSIIDYTGGVDDLNNGIIRIVGDPDRRITRDPARMLRVIRHAARNGFTIEPATWQATRQHRQELKLCPVSRIRDELMKDLRGGASQPWVHLALDSGLFFVIFPFYEQVMAEGCRALLANLFGVIDRLHTQGKLPLPDHILLAILLLPWAAAEMNLLDLRLKGGEAYRLSKKIRNRLDLILEPLCVKRGTKEALGMLLANITLFLGHDQLEALPKWLKKKSYFRECLLLFEIYRESRGNGLVSLPKMAPDTTSGERPAIPVKKGAFRSDGGRSRGPAFARKSRGGIFGLKKK